MGSFLQTLKKLGGVRLAMIGGAMAAVIAFLAISTIYLTKPQLGLLYSNLDLKDSGEVVQKLEGMGVPYEVRGDGSTILVPSDQVAKLRLAMAQNNLPHGASIGYELFDKPEGLGTTDFVQGINEVRALEGELERTIMAIDAVSSARVHLVLPKRELFSRETQEPSASIMLKLRGAAPLTRAQVAAIQNLVASAVPGLKPGKISIVDQSGNLLARGGDEAGVSLTGQTPLEEQRAAYERKLAHSVEEMLERSLGPGHVRVDINADMDYDQTTTKAEIYDPDGQVVRSTQAVKEQNTEAGESGDKPVSVQTNLPEGQQTQSGGGASGGSGSQRTEETTNYEISKRLTTQVHEGGVVKRLSVAVLVDGNYTTDKKGDRTYQPRAAEELNQLGVLVKSAIGYDQKRGDQVQIVNMRFATPEETPGDNSGLVMGFSRGELLHGAETLVIVVAGLLVMLLVVRPVLTRAIDVVKAPEMELDAAGNPVMAGALTGPGGLTALPPPDEVDPNDPNILSIINADGEEAMIDISNIEGRVKASSMRKIGDIVNQHPEAAVAILRSWMYQAQ